MSHNYDVNMYQSLVELLENMSTFLQYATTDDEGITSDNTLPWFLKQTERLRKVVCHHKGRIWRNLLDDDYPWAWFKIAVCSTKIFALMPDCALAPATNKAAPSDKVPAAAKPRLEIVKLTFDSLVSNINSAMDNGDCGSLGNETPQPIWKQICVPRYQRWKRQFEKPNSNTTHNNTNGGGGGAGNSTNKKPDAGKSGDKGKTSASTEVPPMAFSQSPKAVALALLTLQNTQNSSTVEKTGNSVCASPRRNARGCLFGSNCNKLHLT
jgi:hypothetical protein